MTPPTELWPWALAFYARPGVAEACLALQDQCGADVNFLLAAVWLAETGRGRWDQGDLEALAAKLGPWQRDVVRPLRAARRALVADGASISGLRRRLKEVELEAEQIELAAIAAYFAEWPQHQVDAADGLANLMTYAGGLPDPVERSKLERIAAESRGFRAAT
jgi:uncharacterized protein (TIGR02444 family)